MLIVTEFKNNFRVDELYLYICKDYGDNTLVLARIKEHPPLLLNGWTNINICTYLLYLKGTP